MSEEKDDTPVIPKVADSADNRSDAPPVYTLPDILILNLPDGTGFISEPPQYTCLVRMCEKMQPIWNAQRLANPPPEFQGEAFVLHDED